MAIGLRQMPVWRDRAKTAVHFFANITGKIERTLDRQQAQLPLWIPVALGFGIAAWFILKSPGQWLALIGVAISIACLSWGLGRRQRDFSSALLAMGSFALLVALGCGLIWFKSDTFGARPLERPVVARFNAIVEKREQLPAREMVRLKLRTRSDSGVPQHLRVNVPMKYDDTRIVPGTIIALRARLLPPAEAALPGAYDFSRRAWFDGISATGSVLEAPKILRLSQYSASLSRMRQQLSDHIVRQLGGSEGAIAVTLATGDRGAIAEPDAEAMRNSGLAHLLSISGLHVSALIGAVYLLVIKLLALSPSLALRWRLPIVAALVAAVAGLGYTVLTGAEVPTIRACVAAMLVLLALMLGRDPISMRMVAAGATFVLLFWPESLVGPSFQLSFAAVATIIALHDLPWTRATFGAREQGTMAKFLRFIAGLFLTGLAIEAVLTPIALYHFHKAGVYGAFANIIAIPLTTFVIMPFEALALLFDTIGFGAPFWWVCRQGLALLLAIAHFVNGQPGSIARIATMELASFAGFIIGGLWLFLWRGKLRLFGLVPAGAAALSLLWMPQAHILVSGDGRHSAILDAEGRMHMLRAHAGDYTVSTFSENAGLAEVTGAIADMPNSRCSQDFCVTTVRRGDRRWQIMVNRSRANVPERALAAACKRVDIVISDRFLPYSCRPRWMKIDRRLLAKTGGIAIDLNRQTVRTVASQNGEHGWFRPYRQDEYVRPQRPVLTKLQ